MPTEKDSKQQSFIAATLAEMESLDGKKAKSSKPAKPFVSQFIHDFGTDTWMRIIAAADALAEEECKAFNVDLFDGEDNGADNQLRWAIGRVMIAGYLNRKAWRDKNGIAPSYGEFKNWLMPKARADWIGDYDFGEYEVSTIDESDDETLEDDDDAEWQLEFGEYEEDCGEEDDDEEEEAVALDLPKWMPNG